MQGHALIRQERLRQRRQEGWNARHDNQHKNDELLYAAYVYLSHAIYGNESNGSRALWPWPLEQPKPGDRKRNLVKAGALIAAELDRLNRIKE